MNFNEYIPVIVALVGSAGLWGFLSTKAKFTHEKAMKDNETRVQFSDTLRIQVETLSNENKDLHTKVEQLLKEMAHVRAELAESRATIKHLEEMLRNK